MTESDALDLAIKDAQEAMLAMERIKGPKDAIKLYTRFFVHRVGNTGDSKGRTETIESMGRRVDGRTLSTDVVSRTIASLELLDRLVEPEDLMAIMTWLAGPRSAPGGFCHTYLSHLGDGYTEASLSELNDWIERARVRIDAHDRHVFGELAKKLNSAERGIVRSELVDASVAMNDEIMDGETWRHRRIVARKMVHSFLRNRRH